MSFKRPAIRQLISRARSDMKTTIDKINAYLRETFEDVFAITVAGLAHSLHGHIFWASKQPFPSTADEPGVREWAFTLNVPQRDADFAIGNVNFTGTPAASIPIGTQYQRSDGVVFATTSAYVLDGAGTITGQVKAVLSGEAANTEGGTPLTAVSAVAGVSANATVDGSGLRGGADVEDVESIRDRVLFRMQNPPAGGNAADFIRWAKEVPGVTRAWAYPNGLGVGTVLVYFTTDNDVSPIPDAGKVAAVQAYIDSKRPAVGALTVAAPTAVVFNLSLHIVPDTAQIRADTNTALDDYYRRFGSTTPQLPTFVAKSQLDEVISQVPDETSHQLSIPPSDTALTLGQIPVHGTITWV